MRRAIMERIGLLAIGFTQAAFAAGPATMPATQPAAPSWISKPAAAWPRILLTNRVQKSEGVGFSGSAGLGRLPNGVVVLMTAGHLLGDAKAADFKTAFKSWTAVSAPGVSTGARMTSVAMDVSQPSTLDLLILLPASQSGPWPATVLPVRTEPLQEGETVYLIGIPTEESNGKQAVHKGVVVGQEPDHKWLYTLEGTFKTTGNSGAPVIDTLGRLAAINTGHLNNQDEPGHMKLVCISTADALQVVKLPPSAKPLVLTTQPATAPVASANEAENKLTMVEAMKGQIPPEAVRKLLESIVHDYPGTPAAQKAQQKLAAIPK
jgi:hypothetical protein